MLKALAAPLRPSPKPSSVPKAFDAASRIVTPDLPLPVIFDIPAAKNLSGIVQTETNAFDVMFTECVTGLDNKAFNQTSCILSMPLTSGQLLTYLFNAFAVISSLGVSAIVLANSEISCFLAFSQKSFAAVCLCFAVKDCPSDIALNA